MVDMSRFITAKSDQLNADDLLGGPRTVVITRVRGTDAPDQPVAVHFEGDDNKPFKPCKTMRRLMVKVWGADATKYAGEAMTIYTDPDVQFGGMKVGGIRISHMSGLTEEKKFALMQAKGKKGLVSVRPLQRERPPVEQGPSIDEVRRVLADAAKQGDAALRTEWSRKSTAPFRDELQPELDGWKQTAAAADEARATTNTNTGEDDGYDGA